MVFLALFIWTNRRFKKRRRPCLGWFLTCAMIGQAVLLPQRAPASTAEDVVKAAYLYNFTRFIEWPSQGFANADSLFTLCVLGEDTFGNALDSIRGKEVRGRPLEIRHYPRAVLPEGCQMLFISRSERNRLSLLLAALKSSPILTVSDMEDFIQAGGMIGLLEHKQRIQFEVNLTAVRQADLKISSNLLKLATAVIGR